LETGARYIGADEKAEPAWALKEGSMRTQGLIVAAAFSGAEALTCGANGDYAGLEIVNIDEHFANHPLIQNVFAPDGHELYDVYRIFARFDGTTALDRVNAVFGSASSPAFISVTAGSIYNLIDGTGTPDDPFIHYDLPPESLAGGNLAGMFETWVTINQVSGSSTTSFTSGAHEPSQFNHFQESWAANDAAWFIAPDDTHGAASATLWSGVGEPGPKVLIAQISVTEGGAFNGSFNISTGFGDILNQTFAVPGPCAISLLIISRAVRRRKRRSRHRWGSPAR
jgi:hypothetical protein